MLAHCFTNNIRNNVSFVSLYCNICIILFASTGTVQILFVYKIKFITMLVDKVTLIKLLSSISSILPIVNLHTNIVSAHSNTFFIMLIYTVTFFCKLAFKIWPSFLTKGLSQQDSGSNKKFFCSGQIPIVSSTQWRQH